MLRVITQGWTVKLTCTIVWQTAVSERTLESAREREGMHLLKEAEGHLCTLDTNHAWALFISCLLSWMSLESSFILFQVHLL